MQPVLGVYAGYSSHEPSFPDNEITVDAPETPPPPAVEDPTPPPVTADYVLTGVVHSATDSVATSSSANAERKATRSVAIDSRR